MSGIDVVSILDLTKASVVDEFLCYGPTLSPDEKLVAFVKFSPAHFVQGTSSEELIYDLTASHGANMPNGITGIPMYPIGSKNTEGDNVGLPEALIHDPYSGLFWINTSNVLAFAERQQDVVRIVVVDLRNGARNKVIAVRPLNVAAGPRTSPCFASISRNSFHVSNIVRSADTRIFTLRLDIESEGRPCGTLNIALPEIKP